MKFVFVGSGTLAVLTARMLSGRGHEVVVVERDPEMIDALQEELDVGFIHGDGTRPAILREAGPDSTDLLFCLTHDDQANIIASLVARSLGYRRVVTKIEDPELEHICVELGLADSLVPMHTVGQYLADMAEGRHIFAISDILRGEARLFLIRITDQLAGTLAGLELPAECRAVAIYRDAERLIFAEPDTRLAADDELVVLARAVALKRLRQRFG